MGDRDASNGNNRKKQARKGEGEFIPGLPNDIVLQHIATKISLGAMYSLTSVNKKWRRALRSREIYALRVEKGVTQAMVVAFVGKGMCTGSMDVDRQKFYFSASAGYMKWRSAEVSRKSQTLNKITPDEVLDPIPLRGCKSDDGIRPVEGIVCLDGRSYALQQDDLPRQEVLVLDFGACEIEWKHCSSRMADERTQIWVACNRRIYSFSICQSRLHGWAFDPKKNEWTEVQDSPMNDCFR